MTIKIKLADKLTESTVATEGLIAGQTPIRDESLSKGGRKTSRFKDTVQGVPIDWEAGEAPQRIKLPSMGVENSGRIKLPRMSAGGTSIERSGGSVSDDVDFQEMSNFGKTLDILGRPGYAVKSAIGEAQEAAQAGIPISIQKIMEASMDGFSGKERLTANDLYKRAGVEGVPFLGFATEVAVDPLTYVGGSIFRHGARGVKDVASGVKNIIKTTPVLDEAVTKAQMLVKPAVTTLKEMFVTKSNIPELADKVDFYLSQRGYLRGKQLQFSRLVNDKIVESARKLGTTVDDVQKNIVNIIENPELGKNFDKNIADVAGLLRANFSEMLTNELKAGVPITALSGNDKVVGYFPRIAHQDAVKYLKHAKIGKVNVWNPRLGAQMQRKTGEWTLNEFNDFVKANGLESLGGKSIEQYFLKDPARASYIRGSASAKAVTSNQFLQDVSKIFGKTEAPSYWTELPDGFTKAAPFMKGLKFDPDIADEMQRVTRAYLSPEASQPVLKLFDDIQNTWKELTLVLFPKFHIRNMVGNVWNNYLADVKPEAYQKAIALQMYGKFKNNRGLMGKLSGQEIQKFGISTTQADEILENALKTQVIHSGQYGADIDIPVNDLVNGRKRFGKVLQKASEGGKLLEDNAKLAHFVDRLDRGQDVASAALSTKKYLFDYNDLTDFERNVMKRVFPFYTWTRKNIPLQLNQLIERPEKFAPLLPALRNRDQENLKRMELAYPSLAERVPIEIKKQRDVTTYIPMEGIIPAADLAKLVRPQDIALELLSPYLKVPIELTLNKSFYSEREIQEYSGQTQELLRLALPAKLKYSLVTVLPQARIVNELDKIVRKRQKKEKLTIDEQVISQTLSSVYKIPLEEMKRMAEINLKKKINNLQDGAFKASRYGRKDEVNRIKSTIMKVKSQIKDVRN